MKNQKNLSKIAALGAAVALTAAACGSDDAETPVEDDTVTTEAAASTEAPMEETETTDAMEEDGDAMEEDGDAMEEDGDAMEEDAMEEDAMEEEGDAAALAPSGPLCEAVPADGEGSFAGMTDDPAATAASNNPALSTLVAAVTEAGLVDTLNSDGPFTIFAPANPAFEALGEDAVNAVLADQDLLTSILTLHVVAGEQLSSEDLAETDSVTTVNGADITFEVADDGSLMVNGQATVGCADVSTANATVHIIDAVLMPADDAAASSDDAEGDSDDAEGESEED